MYDNSADEIYSNAATSSTDRLAVRPDDRSH